MQPVIHLELFGVPAGHTGSVFSNGFTACISAVPDAIFTCPFENVKLLSTLGEGKKLKIDNALKLIAYWYRQGGLRRLFCGMVCLQLRQFLWSGTFF